MPRQWRTRRKVRATSRLRGDRYSHHRVTRTLFRALPLAFVLRLLPRPVPVRTVELAQNDSVLRGHAAACREICDEISQAAVILLAERLGCSHVAQIGRA